MCPPALSRQKYKFSNTLFLELVFRFQSLYKDVKVMYELKRRHRLVITGAAPKTTGPSTTDLGFNRAELQFIYQVNLKKKNQKINYYKSR